MTVVANHPLLVLLNGVENVRKATRLAWLHRGMPGAHLAGTDWVVLADMPESDSGRL